MEKLIKNQRNNFGFLICNFFYKQTKLNVIK